MQPDTVLRKFTDRKGREVTLRTPRWSDLDDMLTFINGLVEEEAMIAIDTKKTRDEEIEWLANNLKRLEKDQHMSVVAEVDGLMVGSCEFTPRYGRMKHYASLGISLRDGYREAGIGQEMMKELEKHAPRLGVEYMALEVYSINDRAIHVYEKVGYGKIGSYPSGVKYKGEYVDSVHMVKKLIVTNTFLKTSTAITVG
jgi:RimJ/RimL family protein N-acetyltransferase